MFAARTFTRLAAPLARASVRSISTKAPRLTTLSTSKISTAALRQPMLVSRFSTAAARFAPEDGSVDQELVSKLASELALEKEMKGFEDMPESVKSFLEDGPFTVNDKPGHEEVELVRKYGNETIRIEFSISDLNLMGQNDGLGEDESDLYDDEEAHEIRQQNNQSKGGKQGDRAAQEIEEDDEYLDEDQDIEPSFPAHLNIVIEKPSGGCLKIAGLAQDGMIVLQNVIYHQSTDLVNTKSAENDYQSEGLYAGPEFGNLDEDLQVLFERYLDERGINHSLAVFIPDYIEFKEQKEYLKWLESVKGFIQA